MRERATIVQHLPPHDHQLQSGHWPVATMSKAAAKSRGGHRRRRFDDAASTSTDGTTFSTMSMSIASLPTLVTEEHLQLPLPGRKPLRAHVGRTVTAVLSNRLVKLAVVLAAAAGLHALIVWATDPRPLHEEMLASCTDSKGSNGTNACRAARDAYTRRELLSDGLLLVLWLVAAGLALKTLGFSLGSVLAVAGVGSAILAFAAQNMIQDVIAGILVSSEDQYSVGDRVQISIVGAARDSDSLVGTVHDLSLRTTTLRLEVEGSAERPPIVDRKSVV